MKDATFLKNLQNPDKYHDKGDRRVRLAVLGKFGSKCSYCGHPLSLDTLHIDHLQPLMRHIQDANKKGKNNFLNYYPACKSCNSSKNSFPLEKWRSDIEKKLDRLKRDSSTYRLCLRFGLIKEQSTSIKFYFETMEGGNNG